MTSLKVIICGGVCAGLALAYWLSRSGHQVTVIERFLALRAIEDQIDIRAQGIKVFKRMGLLDAISSKLVHESGVSIVDSHGKRKAIIMANTSGKGAQSMTSEYEIMCGGLIRILYDSKMQKSITFLAKQSNALSRTINKSLLISRMIRAMHLIY
jgi:2-polyprenyl-6-methoxyphenol hydroxylase-like FAD-dependent oxidoreductase